MIPEKITIRLGPLRDPLSDHCELAGITPSRAIRNAVATLLGQESPDMPEGRPTQKPKPLEAYRKACVARKRACKKMAKKWL